MDSDGLNSSLLSSRQSAGTRYSGQVARDNARQHVGDNHNVFSNAYVAFESSPGFGHPAAERLGRQLLKAARVGATQRVRMLLGKGADVDLTETDDDRAGWTALHYTAYGGFTNAATALIEHGCILSSSGSDGQTALSLSLKNGHEAIARLISGSDGLDVTLERGCMHLAAKAGYDAVVRNLMNTKCDPFIHDDAERSPLFYAAEEGHSTVVRTLLEVYETLDDPAHDWYFALSVAISYSRAELFRKIMDEYPPPQLDGQELYACRAFRDKLRYPRRGATVIEDRTKWTFLDWAMSDLNPDADVMQMLINHGCDIDAQNGYGDTALHRAVSRRHFRGVQLLLEANARCDTWDRFGRTPVHDAVNYYIDIAFLRLLIEHGAPVDVLTTKNETPLHLAEHMTHVNLLLESGANVNAQDDNGCTPLDRTPKITVRARLVEAGAKYGKDLGRPE